MIAGRTRFYVVAGIVGGISGEAQAGLLALGAAPLVVSRGAALMTLALLLVSGTASGAYAGVKLMRCWYRRKAATKRLVAE